MIKFSKLLGTTTRQKPPGQCTVKTRGGKGPQCKNPALPGTDRCVLPSHQRIQP